MTTTTTRSTRHRLAVAGVVVAALFGLGLGACSDGTDGAAGPLDPTTTLEATDTTDTTTRRRGRAGRRAGRGARCHRGGLAAVDGPGGEAGPRRLHDARRAVGTHPTFTNIAAAETTHTEAVRTLLGRYGIDDPTVDLAPGEFVDPSFTALYDDLVAQGRTSLTEALRVGALIEETDIADLATWTNRIDEPAILTVYGSLNAGSENHLRAFDRALTARGETYAPQVITTPSTTPSPPRRRAAPASRPEAFVRARPPPLPGRRPRHGLGDADR